jgi:hypothetical protein
MNFGTVMVDDSSATTLTVKNTGSATLCVSAAIGLSNVFSVTPINNLGDATDNWNLSPGSIKTFSVRFAPSAAIPFNSTLTLLSTDAAQPRYNIVFSGAGAITGSPGARMDVMRGTTKNIHDVAFGTQEPGQYLSTPLTLRNIGSTTLCVTAAFGLSTHFLNLPDNQLGNVVDNWNINPGQTKTINVAFVSSQPGYFSSTLTMLSTDADHPRWQINFSGTFI